MIRTWVRINLFHPTRKRSSLKSRKLRKEQLFEDKTKDYLKDYIDCKKKDVDCRGCEYETYCKTIATRKEMGIPNPWERAWLDRKVQG